MTKQFHCWDYIPKCYFFKQPKCPSVNKWIKKLWYIYMIEYYTVEGNNELLHFATAWRKLESIMLSEISQALKDKYHMISFINQQKKQASKI